MDNKPATVNAKYIGESQTQIRDYIATEPVNLHGEKEKNEYLRLAAMVLLWDLKLPPYCINELKKMKTSGNTRLKQNAATVLEVLEVLKENR
jgi:hypothetical protein